MTAQVPVGVSGPVSAFQLEPGDTCKTPDGREMLVVAKPQEHPFYSGFLLVIWLSRTGEYSFDALAPRQVIDSVVRPYPMERRLHLSNAYNSKGSGPKGW